jgi:hypothetical protein
MDWASLFWFLRTLDSGFFLGTTGKDLLAYVSYVWFCLDFFWTSYIAATGASTASPTGDWYTGSGFGYTFWPSPTLIDSIKSL